MRDLQEKTMAKGQQRGNREAKKPKASKVAVAPPSSAVVPKTTKPLPTKGHGK